MISRFVANSEKCCNYALLGGSAQIVSIVHRGVIEIYYNITMGGLPDLLQIRKKCRKYTFLGGSAQIITKLHRGGYRNLLQYHMGGSLANCIT